MSDIISAKNCRIDIKDHPEDDHIYLNIYFNNANPGEYKQVVIPRNKAKALAYIILGEE